MPSGCPRFLVVVLTLNILCLRLCTVYICLCSALLPNSCVPSPRWGKFARGSPNPESQRMTWQPASLKKRGRRNLCEFCSESILPVIYHIDLARSTVLKFSSLRSAAPPSLSPCIVYSDYTPRPLLMNSQTYPSLPRSPTPLHEQYLSSYENPVGSSGEAPAARFVWRLIKRRAIFPSLSHQLGSMLKIWEWQNPIGSKVVEVLCWSKTRERPICMAGNW